MKKPVYIIFIILFFGMCTIPLAGMLLGYKNVNAEKRALAPPPDIFTDKGFNEDVTQEFDDYFTDNFAFRPNYVTMYAYINAALLGESVSDQVIIGKDGWLFFEPTLNDYMKVETLSGNGIYRLAKTLDIQSRYIESRGKSFIFTAAPNKASVYGQYMPDRFKTLGEVSNAEALYRALKDLGVEYVDLHAALRKGGEQLYHKLDTHWNNKGALIAYNELLGRVKELVPGFVYNTHEGLVPRLEKTWEGDLSAMLYPAAGMLDEQYVYDIPKEYSTERPMKSPEDILIKSRSEDKSTGLLMFRDSFANALIPILSNELKSVTYSRAVPYDYSLMGEDTDVVIIEIAERNIPDMLRKAPLMPALQAEISGELTPADMRITLVTEDSKDYIKLMGIALPPGYSADENYDIYMRLSMDGQQFTFETFPILEEEFSSRSSESNAAFSMVIDKKTLPPGEYDAEVIVSADGQRYICKYEGSISHRR